MARIPQTVGARIHDRRRVQGLPPAAGRSGAAPGAVLEHLHPVVQRHRGRDGHLPAAGPVAVAPPAAGVQLCAPGVEGTPSIRSEEHTSELQSLMRTSYAVFCFKKKKHNTHNTKI